MRISLMCGTSVEGNDGMKQFVLCDVPAFFCKPLLPLPCIDVIIARQVALLVLLKLGEPVPQLLNRSATMYHCAAAAVRQK